MVVLTSPLNRECLFDLPHLVWCDVRFSPDDTYDVAHDGIRIELPQNLHKAVPKRRSEFLAGRLCAAMVLREMDLPQHVGINNRAPVWPAGVVGSISHNDSRAVAVISTQHKGIGVDVEEVMPLERAQKLHGEFMDDAELSLQPADMSFANFTTLVFSAKEAFYKSVSARVGRILGFHEVILTDVGDAVVMLEFEGEVSPVQWRILGGECLALAAR